MHHSFRSSSLALKLMRKDKSPTIAVSTSRYAAYTASPGSNPTLPRECGCHFNALAQVSCLFVLSLFRVSFSSVVQYKVATQNHDRLRNSKCTPEKKRGRGGTGMTNIFLLMLPYARSVRIMASRTTTTELEFWGRKCLASKQTFGFLS